MSDKLSRVVLTTTPASSGLGFDVVQTKTNFGQVVEMNEAFYNKPGNPSNPDWGKLLKLHKNLSDELNELLVGINEQNLYKVRDALCDLHVFGYGGHHQLGLDADADMEVVVSAVMTRFIKDDADKAATIAKHAANGITDVYFEGEYPKMCMKSASDQPDAPKGKFLKSASFWEPVFHGV